MTVAQRFIAGFGSKKQPIRPIGTMENEPGNDAFDRPYGTWDFSSAAYLLSSELLRPLSHVPPGRRSARRLVCNGEGEALGIGPVSRAQQGPTVRDPACFSDSGLPCGKPRVEPGETVNREGTGIPPALLTLRCRVPPGIPLPDEPPWPIRTLRPTSAARCVRVMLTEPSASGFFDGSR